MNVSVLGRTLKKYLSAGSLFVACLDVIVSSFVRASCDTEVCLEVFCLSDGEDES